ncbi:hypothetical protein TNCV_3077021 [Trichonephila clavipes]|nr:hypothetical protein TNCV_3077021 [Trichonephila clavipes]
MWRAGSCSISMYVFYICASGNPPCSVSGDSEPRGYELPRCALPFSRTDEAHFWLKGYVNKQNCRIWSEANPQVIASKAPSGEIFLQARNRRKSLGARLGLADVVGPSQQRNAIWFCAAVV